jgi:hypothetical protein
MPTGLDYFWEELSLIQLTVISEIDYLQKDPLYRSPVTASVYQKLDLLGRVDYIGRHFSREQVSQVLRARAPFLKKLERGTIAHELLTWQLEPLYMAFKRKAQQ